MIDLWQWCDTNIGCYPIQELLQDPGHPKSHVTRIIEGYETVVLKSKFAKWPQTTDVAVSEEGRGKVAG